MKIKFRTSWTQLIVTQTVPNLLVLNGEYFMKNFTTKDEKEVRQYNS